MKPPIYHDGNESILSGIRGCGPFPTMETTKKSGSLLDLKAGHKCNESTLRNKGWERSNLVEM
jgi:hypothetical protein